MGRQKVRWAKPSARRESSVAHLLPGETSGGRQEPEEGGRARAERKLLRVTTDFLHGAFSASLVKVLRPRMLDSQGNFQIRCMACSSDGKLVITGGSLSCPGGDNTRNFVGALVPWRRSINRHDFGQWHCWAANQAEEHLLPPVTCLSLEGSCLVSGHASTGDVRKDDLSSPSPFHTTSMQAFRSFKPRSRWAVAGVICVWTIDRNTEDMVLCFKHTEGDGGDVTAVKILQARRHGLPLRMASVATSGTVTIWSGLDHENPNLIMLYSFPAHNDKVSSLAYLPRVYGTYESAPDLLATASSDKTVVIWRLLENSAELVHTLVHAREVYGAEFHPGDDIDTDSEYLVTVNHDKTMRIWHVGSGICIHEAQHDDPVMAIDYQSTGEMIATGTQGGLVSIFDSKTGICMRTMSGHKGEITAVKFLDNANLLASTSADGTLRLWEVRSRAESVLKLGERSMVLDGQGGHGKTVYSIDIRKDCEMLATASRDYTVRLWNCSSGRLMASLVGHSNFVFKVVMHPSKPICASASHDGTIKFWCTVTGSCLQTHPPTEDLSAQDVDEMGYHSAEVSAVAFHPHRDIMASVSYDMSLIMYTFQTFEESEEPALKSEEPEDAGKWSPYIVLNNHKDRIWDVAFSHHGKFVATGAWDNDVHIYSMDDLEPVSFGASARSTEDMTDPPFSKLNCVSKVWTVAFQPVEGKPFLLTGAADSKIRMWTKAWGSWKLHSAMEGHSNTVTGIAWHPAGHMFVSSSFDKTVRLWILKQSGEADVMVTPAGLFSAYSWPTMAVAWSYQPCSASNFSNEATMISIALLDGSTFLMDASDAGQSFVPHARARHVLMQGEGFNRDMVIEMVKDFPQSLMSLGEDSLTLMHSIIQGADDLRLAKRMLELYEKSDITPLLPYGPKGQPLLATVNSYHGVAAIVDCVVGMGHEGAVASAAAMATGMGTCVVLMLIERFPDQAVRLMQHIGMVRSNDVLYEGSWNRRRRLPSSGMITHSCTNLRAGSTRYPLGLWTAENKSSSFLRILQKWLPGEEDSEPVDIVAVHSTFPYVAGLVPEEYLEQTETRSMLTSFSAAEGKTEIPDYSTLEKSFLHLAYESDEPHLFETPLGQAVLLFKWEAYGKRVLLAQAMVYLLQLCSVCMQAYSLGRLNHGGGWVLTTDEHQYWEGLAVASSGLVLAFSLLQSLYEVLQIHAQGIKLYLGEFWSVLDVLVLILGMVSGGLGLVDFSTDKAGSSSSKWACAISSIATFFSWLKAFYFLRAFPTTGGLVRMVVEIGFDMRYLLVLLMVVMMGASTSLFVLMTINYQPAITGETEGCTIDDWETLSGFILGQDVYAGEPIGCKPPLSFWGMIMYAFSMMLGGFDIYFFDSLNEFRLLGQVLFIIYILFQMVLLLNLLIAFMGDSYAKVQEKAKTEALRERAGLLVEIELVMGQSYLKRNNYCPRWLHALVPKETVQVGESRRQQEWAGITGTIRQYLETHMSVLRANFREEIVKHSKEISENLASKIMGQLHEMRKEMHEMRPQISPTISTAPRRARRMSTTPGKPPKMADI